MNIERKTLVIADTSDGFNSLLLPEAHKVYPRLIAAALSRPLKSQENWEILARTLIRICQCAHAARQIAVLREISDFLVSLPVRKELQTIGMYYQAQVLHRTGELTAARIIFEQLATHAQFPWKHKAIASAGTCYFDSGDLDTSATLYQQAHRAAVQSGVDLVTALKSQWMIGRIQSIQGDHEIALKSLESLYPLVRQVSENTHPAVYYDYLNSLAFRLMSLNRLDKAEILCDIVLSSPFVHNFSYWIDTRDELRTAREAVAATVFVNVQHKPERRPRLKAHPIETPEFAAAPVTRPSTIFLEETESIIDSQLFCDRAAIEIIQSHIETQINTAQAISASLKPHSDISFVAYLRFPITSTSKQNLSAVQPEGVVASQARPVLITLRDVVPDNSRPRAPPISITSREY